jgi:hypothetical protein
MILASIRRLSAAGWKARTLVTCGLLLAVANPVQSIEPKKGSPEEALDRFYRLINDGALLTRDGWTRAARMFERQSSRPDKEVILVVTGFPLGNGPIDTTGDRAVACQKWVDDVGTIDSKFRFHPPPKEELEVEMVMHIFKLVHTGTHWDLAGDGRPHEVNGPVEWRLEGSLTERTASRAAAIRYLLKKRDEITDPALRANAERTIGILRSLPKRRTHI